MSTDVTVSIPAKVKIVRCNLYVVEGTQQKLNLGKRLRIGEQTAG